MCGPPAGAPDEADTCVLERRDQFLIEQAVLLFHEGVSPLADVAQHLPRGEHVRALGRKVQFQALPESANPDLKELIEVRRDNAEEFQTLQQRDGGVLRLVQDPPVELKGAEFAIDEIVGEFEVWGVQGENPRNRKKL